MIDFIKRLFGEGYIYSDFTCSDGTIGRSKERFVGDPSTFDKQEYTIQLKEKIWYKYGKRIVTSNSRIVES